MTNNNVDSMAAEFGVDDTASFMRALRATRSYVRVWGTFLHAEDGSAVEAAAEHGTELMAQGMREQPDKAVVVAQILVSLVHHLNDGGDIEGFFANLDDAS